MKKTSKKQRDHDMLEEYEFSKGVRGKYAQRLAQGSNIIVLAPDLAEIFPDSESVNEVLHALVKLARKSTKRMAPQG
jgi:hypothetical protein